MFKANQNLIALIVTPFFLFILSPSGYSQAVELSPEDLIRYTSEWDGDRFPDGRPSGP